MNAGRVAEFEDTAKLLANPDSAFAEMVRHTEHHVAPQEQPGEAAQA